MGGFVDLNCVLTKFNLDSTRIKHRVNAALVILLVFLVYFPTVYRMVLFFLVLLVFFALFVVFGSFRRWFL